jgi:hypothetical protein
VLLAGFAVLQKLKAVLQCLLVLLRTVVQGLTDRALQLNEVVLGHNEGKPGIRFRVSEIGGIVRKLSKLVNLSLVGDHERV